MLNLKFISGSNFMLQISDLNTAGSVIKVTHQLLKPYFVQENKDTHG